uniref:Reverse transcriptase domain-containing protein n=1 Tax=Lygus hesperus TaxID=30085 RepID=A0A0K8SGB4_LYGHE
MKGFEERLQVDVISTDYSKAFDKLSHRHVLLLLESLGIHGAFLRWLTSYLTGRQLRVRIKNTFSRPFVASSGVPQGSHIGPLIFLIMINGVSKLSTDVKFLIFADDLKNIFVYQDI